MNHEETYVNTGEPCRGCSYGSSDGSLRIIQHSYQHFSISSILKRCFSKFICSRRDIFFQQCR